MITAESYIGSNDFWNTVITVFATMVIGALTIWAALYVAKPRRRILWVEASNTSLLSDDSLSGAFAVAHAGATVANPRLVTLMLKNAGKRDIREQDFSSGDGSLVFDFGVPVVSVLSVEVQPASAPTPETVVDVDAVSVKKGLIKTGQTITLTVLVDGERESVECRSAHLVETSVRDAKSREGLLPLWHPDRINAILVVPVLASGVVFASVAVNFIAENAGQVNCQVASVEVKAVDESTCDILRDLDLRVSGEKTKDPQHP